MIRLLAPFVLALLAATAPAGRAETERLRVVTSFTIIQDMAANVAGARADIVSLTPPGADIHLYEPTPRDILRISNADLVLLNGLELEAWFGGFLDNAGEAPRAVVSDGLVPMAISGGEYDGQPNPHGWMGLDGAAIYIGNIAQALSDLDPANADEYRENAQGYLGRIEARIGPLRDRLRALPEKRRVLVTSEGAFSYLARDAHLGELFLWPVNADQQGLPQQVRRVIDAVRARNIPAVFSESTVSARPAQQIARETGAAYGGVLFVDTLSARDGPVPSYIDLLAVTSETILRGLSDG
ncbi:MAG: metal ABC transporter substrate-binding protein [Paracoccus sp. (in: a-proteobacteria)]|nr:metal ABC transporter substrate-binding protein [Paracoccus sp. (in: a-proteobacteria)]